MPELTRPLLFLALTLSACSRPAPTGKLLTRAEVFEAYREAGGALSEENPATRLKVDQLSLQVHQLAAKVAELQGETVDKSVVKRDEALIDADKLAVDLDRELNNTQPANGQSTRPVAAVQAPAAR